jgi:thiamine-phosphate pyrophosphorylase
MSAAHIDLHAQVAPQRARLRGLYAVTPDEPDTERLSAAVDAAIVGGASAVQYRNKSATAALRYQQAATLARVCAVRRALFIVNDDAALARAVDADGVHLGDDDSDLAAARNMLGAVKLIGVSCYDDLDRARAQAAAGADYVAFGSFFASQVKPHARRPDVTLLTRARNLGVPVVAIGGITAANARSLAIAGAAAVAVISAVFAHDDPADIERAAAAIAACFELPD